MFLLLRNNCIKKQAILLLAFLFCKNNQVFSQPQNLVPNGGFENYDTCVSLRSNLINAIPWFGAQCGYNTVPPYNYICGSASSDFYHICQGEIPNIIVLGENIFQYPRNGIGMAGAGIVFIPTNDGREYLEVTLTEKLKLNKKYCGSFHTNTIGVGGTMVSGIGAYFSKDTLLQQGFFDMINVHASIQSPIGQVVVDSAGWTCIKGIYTALGDELMMTVGSFLPWDSIEYIAIYPPPLDYGIAYYFFDDFSVVELPEFSLTQSKDSICAGDSVLIAAATSSLWPGLQHRWYTKGNNNIKDALLLQTYVKPNQTTTYYFQFFDTINEVPCLVDYVDSVTVFVKPTYNLVVSPSDTIICAGKSIAIGVNPFENLQYQWDPTVYLSNANSSKTIATPSNTITYTLTTLADSSNRSCLGINSASIQITVAACEPTAAPIIPSTLSFGSTLQLQNLYSNSTLKIYNELGQVIYENKNYQNNWQAFVSAGVYLIRLDYKDSANQNITLSVKLLVLK